MTFPFAFSLVGLPLAIAGTLIIVILVRISMVLLLHTDDTLEMHAPYVPRRRTFPTIVQLALGDGIAEAGRCDSGRALYWLTLIVIVLGQLGTLIGYLQFIGSNISQLFPSVPVQWAIVAATAAVLIPSLIPRMRALAPVSLLGIAALLSAFIAFAVYCGSSSNDATQASASVTPAADVWLQTKWSGTFRFAGICLFAAEGITALPSVKYSLRARGPAATGDLMRMLDGALLIMTALLLGFGVLGWSCLGASPPSIVTQGLSQDSVAAQVVRAALAIYITCTYPLQLFPAIEAVDDMLTSSAGRGSAMLGRAGSSGGSGSAYGNSASGGGDGGDTGAASGYFAKGASSALRSNGYAIVLRAGAAASSGSEASSGSSSSRSSSGHGSGRSSRAGSESEREGRDDDHDDDDDDDVEEPSAGGHGHGAADAEHSAGSASSASAGDISSGDAHAVVAGRVVAAGDASRKGKLLQAASGSAGGKRARSSSASKRSRDSSRRAASCCDRLAGWCCGYAPRRRNGDDDGDDASRSAFAPRGAGSPICNAALRITFVLVSGLIASQVRSFAAILAFVGWLAFGALSFVLPPLIYVRVIRVYHGSTPAKRAELDRGLHWWDWARRLTGLSTSSNSGSSGVSGSGGRSTAWRDGAARAPTPAEALAAIQAHTHSSLAGVSTLQTPRQRIAGSGSSSSEPHALAAAPPQLEFAGSAPPLSASSSAASTSVPAACCSCGKNRASAFAAGSAAAAGEERVLCCAPACLSAWCIECAAVCSCSCGCLTAGGAAGHSSESGASSGLGLSDEDPLRPSTSESPLRRRLPPCRSLWAWERTALYAYLWLGSAVSLAGMVMVIYESVMDQSGTDTVGNTGGV